MFILTLEWFGLPDELKKHSEQLDYGFKGKSNDQLRQGVDGRGGAVHGRDRDPVPAHHDAEQDVYVIDCPFPARVRRGAARVAARRRADRLGRGDHALARARADEPGLRPDAAARVSDDGAKKAA